MINPMAVRTGAVYGSLLLMVGVMLPFLPVWLAARGFSIADVAMAWPVSRWCGWWRRRC